MTFLLLVVLVVAACSNNNQTSSDPAAAQQLLPNIVGYNTQNVDNIVDALTTAGAGAFLAQGNLPIAGAFARAETVLQCLQDKGAAGGRTYIQQTLSDIIPEAGTAIVINNDRLNENFLGCFLTTGQEGFRAQALTIEPCAEGGTFTFQGGNYSYVYVGVGDEICGYFSQHFTSLKGGG
jgi:hypothetical protein